MPHDPCTIHLARPCGTAGFEPGTPHATVWLRDEHDISNVVALRQVLAAAVAETDQDITVDLAEVTFISTATVRCLLTAKAAHECRDRSFELFAPSPTARRMLDLLAIRYRAAGDVLDSATTVIDVRTTDHRPAGETRGGGTARGGAMVSVW